MGDLIAESASSVQSEVAVESAFSPWPSASDRPGHLSRLFDEGPERSFAFAEESSLVGCSGLLAACVFDPALAAGKPARPVRLRVECAAAGGLMVALSGCPLPCDLVELAARGGDPGVDRQRRSSAVLKTGGERVDRRAVERVDRGDLFARVATGLP